jgi:hypothetical protein
MSRIVSNLAQASLCVIAGVFWTLNNPALAPFWWMESWPASESSEWPSSFDS